MRADDSQVGQAGATVFPVKTTDIAMVAERVVAEGGVNLTCEYDFRNSGPTRTLTIGFPQPTVSGDERGEVDVPITDFHVFDGGRELEVQTIKGKQDPQTPEASYSRFLVFDVEFPKDETKTIKHTYHYTASSEDAGMQRRFNFILKTGALWYGPIGSLDFTVNGLHTFLIDRSSMSLPGAEFTEDAVAWHIKDLKPDRDLSFTWSERPSVQWACRYLEAFHGKTCGRDETQFLINKLLSDSAGFVGPFLDDCTIRFYRLVAGRLSAEDKARYFKRFGITAPEVSDEFIRENMESILALVETTKQSTDPRTRLATILDSFESDRVKLCVLNSLGDDPAPGWFDLKDAARTSRMLDQMYALHRTCSKFRDSDCRAYSRKLSSLLTTLQATKPYAAQASRLLERLAKPI